MSNESLQQTVQELKDRVRQLESDRDRLEQRLKEREQETQEKSNERSGDKPTPSRRQLLTSAGIGAAGFGLAGLSSAAFGQNETSRPQEVINAKEVSGDLYVAQFEGGSLDERVQNALRYVLQNGGRKGRLIINPRNDGKPWVWRNQLKIDPTKYNGLELIFANSVQIRYSGSEWTIWVDTDWQSRDQNGIRIIGGKWHSTGNAAGWLRSDDTYRAQYAPDEVHFDSQDSVGIQVRNVDGWSEEYMIGGRGVGHIKAGTGIELLGSVETGGNGTDSHHGGLIKGLAAVKAHNIAINVSCRLQYGGIYSTTLRPWSNNTRMLYLNPPTFSNKDSGRLDGMIVFNCKFEDAGGGGATQGGETGEVAVRLGPRYDNWYGPVAIANHAWVDKKGSAHQNARHPQFLNLKMQAGYIVNDWISGETGKIQID